MKYLTKSIAFAVALGFGVAAAGAAGDPIAARKGLMKSVGFSHKNARQMATGKMPYDAVKAQLAARTINAVAVGVVNFFPKGSETGGKTTASPKIWSDMGGFAKLAGDLASASAAAAAAAPKGLDAFKAAYGSVGKLCGQCHKAYRVKKKK